jgi:transcriptional regulator with XRE-family HTH domain
MRRIKMLSEKLRAAIKLNPVPAYKIAHAAGLDPSTLSKLMCGITKVKPEDPRVLKVGKILGVPPHQCFESDDDQGARNLNSDRNRRNLRETIGENRRTRQGFIG